MAEIKVTNVKKIYNKMLFYCQKFSIIWEFDIED